MITRLLCSLLILHLMISLGHSQIGQFDTALDIGNPAIEGSSIYDQKTQTYIMRGGGENIWFNHDEFQFLFRKIQGDFILTANFELVGNEDGNGHRKTGWMIRESTDDDAVSINSCIHGDGLAVLQWRLMRGAYMRDPEDEIFFPKKYFGESVIQLERRGHAITMRLAHPGEPLEEMGAAVFPELNDEVLVGPYVLAHDPEDTQEARIWNVSIVRPVAPDWHPNPLVETISHKDVSMSCRLEILDINTRKRKVVQQSYESFSAPYFYPDGSMIYFEKGNKTYEVSISGGKPMESSAEQNGEPDALPGDQYYSDGSSGTQQIYRQKEGGRPIQLTHGLEHAWFPQLSPDGSWLAYLAFPHDSNPSEPPSFGKVSIKLMSTKGGAPKTLAYFYGGKGSFGKYAWSQDGKSLVFVSHEYLK